MRILYLDCFSGISGDMAVGALIDAGVPLDVVRDAVAAVGLSSDRVELSVRSVVRSQIHAVKFDVIDRTAHDYGLAAGSDEGRGHEPGQEHGHEPGHSHEHEHEHGDSHERTDEPGAVDDGAHGHTGGRAHADIIRMIEGSTLAPRVAERALAIFRAIAIAEARIHDMEVDAVHFHEVGALDSIVDIVGFSAALEHLGVDRIFTSAVPMGSGGMLRSAHGAMPLPAPATAEILKGYPVRLTAVPFELTTPTGAGIVKALSAGTLELEEITIDRIGFGAGTRELPDRPNLLRAIVGELARRYSHDTAVVIEASIDDMNPQIYPWLLERLLQSGALDCHLTSVIMKKGRPGMVLTVLAPPGAVQGLARVIFDETTSIGIRYREVDRMKLEREEVIIPTPFGPVRMKRVVADGEERVIPEFEEARRIALEQGLPLSTVMRRLADAARKRP